MNELVAIRSSDFWVKIVEMLQQNWAVIEPYEDGIRIYFINDVGGVFDEIPFSSEQVASDALARNGFRRFLDHPDLQSFLRPPSPPFRRTAHPNGPIYSSGRFWRP
jgi:hypothetical protein